MVVPGGVSEPFTVIGASTSLFRTLMMLPLAGLSLYSVPSTPNMSGNIHQTSPRLAPLSCLHKTRDNTLEMLCQQLLARAAQHERREDSGD